MKIELINDHYKKIPEPFKKKEIKKLIDVVLKKIGFEELGNGQINIKYTCLLYTSPSPRDVSTSRMPSSA